MSQTILSLVLQRSKWFEIKWMALGLAGAIATAALIDNWLPYALLSHHNRAVETHPKIFDVYGVLPQTIQYQSDELPNLALHLTGTATPDKNRNRQQPDGQKIDIRGWFIEGDSSNQTVIILHGLGATRQDMLDFALPLHQAGYNLALIDLRSHGDSGGKFFTYGYHEWHDVVGLLDWLDQSVPNAAQDITIIGVSVGGAIAIPAAAYDSRIDRLITIATFANLNDTIRTQTPLLPHAWRQRAIAKAENLAKFEVETTVPSQTIQHVDRPTLIIHGDRDGYVPVENGQALYDAANQPKQLYLIEGADHANVLFHRPAQLHSVILDFIAFQHSGQ